MSNPLTAGSILLGLALLALVALFVLRPLLTPVARSGRPNTPRPVQSPRARLLAQKEALLTEIESLTFDVETGKLSPETYQHERARRVAAAADILRRLDALPPIDGDRLAAIEAAVAARRTAAPTEQAELPATVRCPGCDRPMAAGDNFCARCGQPLSPAA